MDKLKIDNDKKEIKISIRELIYPDSDTQGSSSLPFYLRTNLGTEIHTNYQNSTKIEKKHTRTNVKSEYRVKLKKQVGNWVFIITGRTDLVQITNNRITVEEIKSVNSLATFNLDSESGRLYTLQLLFYAQYFKETYPDKDIRCKLIIIDIFTDEKKIFSIEYNPYSTFLEELCELILQQILTNTKQLKIKKQRADSIQFPYENFRPHQDEIVQKTTTILEEKKRLLLLAPSGLGKTIGTLYPALKYAIGHGKRVFVVTSKTTQQKMYEDTLRLLVRKKAEFNAIILTAKEKMCNNHVYSCDPMFCKYAQQYPANYELLIKSMLKTNVLNSRYIRKKAKENDICPFELALDCSLYCDIIVGDYNYVFSPLIKLQRYFLGKYKEWICLIDESHNLPDRARDYYSPEFSQDIILECINFIQEQSIKTTFKKKIIEKLLELDNYIEKLMISLNNPETRVVSIQFDGGFFASILEELENLVIAYVGNFFTLHGNEPMMRDPFIIFVKRLHFFNQLLEQSHLEEFEQLIYPKEKKIKIFCKSAAKFLKKQMKGFHSVIAQSATLHPIGYYREMLGFPEDAEILQYTCPFPLENRLYIDYPYVSTRYHDRDSTYSNIARFIHDAIKIESGNYLVFFPSFSYLHNVHSELMKLPLTNQLIVQDRRMTEKSRKIILEKLESGVVPYLLLGVHGGIFSEGVSFDGNMAIGAFIVSPGLPQYCYEQELMKNYYQKQYFKGFEFAYRNPGITRVIQAAGRVFRSETDRGFIALIGQRFHTEYYRSVFPKDWNVQTPQDYSLCLKDFWNAKS